jgi:uncharacterized membrane protein (DUF485 family)
VRLDLLIMAAGFAAGTLLALLFGAINTGTAFAFGQIGFAIAAVYVIGRRP